MPAQAVSCQLSPEVTKADVVNHLNANISQLYAWRSTDVRITARNRGGLPTSLSAVIAVESPRNFRLMVNSVAGNEVDLGSNSERFWFWVKRAEPKNVITASHNQIGNVQSRLRIPFQPDWLIETLGVIPIDESEVMLERDGPESSTLRLVSDRLSPQGHRVRKVTTIDACSGYVLEQSLQNAAGGFIAKAVFNNHKVDPVTGIVVPHQIHLNWPEAEMSLTMKLGHVEINPTGMPSQTWQIPELPGYPPLDLGQISMPRHR